MAMSILQGFRHDYYTLDVDMIYIPSKYRNLHVAPI